MADPNKIIPYKKCCEIVDGTIIRMFWEHPSHIDPFDHDRVLKYWEKEHPDANYTSAQFLNGVGFKNENVIRDGVRPSPA
jgi:hypothetical protein